LGQPHTDGGHRVLAAGECIRENDLEMTVEENVSESMRPIVTNPEGLYELVDQPLPATEWFRLTQDRVNTFAEATMDHQFIHVDEERAKNTPFGGTIGHGFLTLSLITYFASQYSPEVKNVAMMLNYGCDNVRFLAPVKVGASIRARATITEVSEKSPGRFLLTTHVSIDIEGQDKPALVGEMLGMVVFQESSAAS